MHSKLHKKAMTTSTLQWKMPSPTDPRNVLRVLDLGVIESYHVKYETRSSASVAHVEDLSRIRRHPRTALMHAGANIRVEERVLQKAVQNGQGRADGWLHGVGHSV